MSKEVFRGGGGERAIWGDKPGGTSDVFVTKAGGTDHCHIVLGDKGVVYERHSSSVHGHRERGYGSSWNDSGK